MKKIILYLIFLFSLSLLAEAQKLEIEARLDTNHALIGDQVNLIFKITKSKKLKVAFPHRPDTIVEGVEVLSQTPVDTHMITNKEQLLTKEYLLTCFDSGVYVIPPMEVPFEYMGQKDTAYSKSTFLQVFTMQIDTTKQAIADIKPGYNTPLTFDEFVQRFYPYFVGLLVLAILIVAGYFIYVKYIKKKPESKPEPKKPSEPSHIYAYRELDRIKTEKLWQNNKVKEYYSQVTEVVRRYVEYRFEMPALERTSNEIIEEFNRNGLIAGENVELLTQLFNTADFVKFAKANPSPDENSRALDLAYKFVDNTKIRLSETLKENAGNSQTKQTDANSLNKKEVRNDE